jgi:hypothetical protein
MVGRPVTVCESSMSRPWALATAPPSASGSSSVPSRVISRPRARTSSFTWVWICWTIGPSPPEGDPITRPSSVICDGTPATVTPLISRSAVAVRLPFASSVTCDSERMEPMRTRPPTRCTPDSVEDASMTRPPPTMRWSVRAVALSTFMIEVSTVRPGTTGSTGPRTGRPRTRRSCMTASVLAPSGAAWAVARMALPDTGSVGAPSWSEPVVWPSGACSSAKTVSGYLYWRQRSRTGFSSAGRAPPNVPHSRFGPRMAPLPGKKIEERALWVLDS